jgi:hypothetical protein
MASLGRANHEIPIMANEILRPEKRNGDSIPPSTISLPFLRVSSLLSGDGQVVLIRAAVKAFC